MKRSSRREPGPDLLLRRHRHEGIAVVDEEELDRPGAAHGERVAQEVHVDDARRRLLGRRERLAVDLPPGGGVGQRVTAAPHAELSRDRRQRQDRGRGGAAVAVAFLAPSAPQGRRARVRVEPREALDVLRGHPRLGGGPLESPRRGPALELLCSGRVRREKRAVLPAVDEEPPDHGECERQIRPRMRREVEVRPFGEPRTPRIHDDEPGAPLLRLLEIRKKMDPGHGRVHAPEHDQLRLGVIGIRDPGHLPVERGVGRRRRRGADRARQSRGAQAAEESRIGRALREVAVRAAVVEREDRLCPAPALDLEELAGDQREGLVPRGSSEPALALGAVAQARMQEARLAVHVARVLADLRADVRLRHGVEAGAADRDDPAGGDRDVEAAGVRAVERTDARDVALRGRRPRLGAHPLKARMRSIVSTAMGW